MRRKSDNNFQIPQINKTDIFSFLSYSQKYNVLTCMCYSDGYNKNCQKCTDGMHDSLVTVS